MLKRLEVLDIVESRDTQDRYIATAQLGHHDSFSGVSDVWGTANCTFC